MAKYAVWMNPIMPTRWKALSGPMEADMAKVEMASLASLTGRCRRKEKGAVAGPFLSCLPREHAQRASSAKMSFLWFSGTNIRPITTVPSAITIGYHRP